MGKEINEKSYGVEEYHRGEWTPLLVKTGEKDKDGKAIKKQKIVKTTEDYAEILNGDAKQSKLRYVLIEEKKQSAAGEGSDPKQQAKELKASVLKMETVEEIDKAIEGITWKSVLKAAEDRKKELTA